MTDIKIERIDPEFYLIARGTDLTLDIVDRWEGGVTAVVSGRTGAYVPDYLRVSTVEER